MPAPEKSPDEMTPDELADYNESFNEGDLANWLEYIAEHGSDAGYEPPEDEIDLDLTTTPGRGCMVGWYCRKHGETAPGCEKHCMFTRDVAEPRPNCFGFHSGDGVLEVGQFLFTVLNLTCLDCSHFLACAEETEARWCHGHGGD